MAISAIMAKKLISLLFSICIVSAIGIITIPIIPIYQNADAQQSSQCHPSLWKHVYNPKRLGIIKDCLTVKGTIISHKSHADGDIHIWVLLDSAYKKYLTPASKTVCSSLHGKSYCNLLIAEPVCQHKPTLKIAIASCVSTKGTWLHKINVPPDGSHVSITGSYVTDDQHKDKHKVGWAEIHPVSNIKIVK